ncbi:MAG: hypothetical protein LH624_00555 [Cryobacterium sp.]|nr:hypothetical protein [Cryobacterium sp.]
MAVGGSAPLTPPPPAITEFGPSPDVNEDVPNSQSAAHVSSAHVPRPVSSPVTGPSGTSVQGLNFRDQRLADGGNQFSLEPPDQALCVSDSGYILEAVNDAFAFYQGGARVSNVMALNPFFTNDHAIVRSTPPVFGTFVSDPKCYFDPELMRFYFTVLTIDTHPATGAFTGATHIEIAVSRDSHPTTDPSSWFHYRIRTTNDAAPDAANPASVANPDCPCLGDQPLIGADKYGFFVTTNEFPLFTDGFNGAIVYAMDKAALANGALHNLTLGANRPGLAEGPGYSIQPASSPTTADWQTANNGTEYFLSALDFDATLDNRIAVWQVTNTQSLTTTTPNLSLTNKVLASEVYGQPPAAEQRRGQTPLADALKEHENLLDSNDDRMQQVVYVRPGGIGNGYLASGLNTVVKTENGPTHVGIAWFVVQPTALTQADAAISQQGYISVNRQNVMFPAVALNHNGTGAMVYTLVGPDYYPSAAFTPFSVDGAAADVRIGALGNAPADGFTGYRYYGGNGVERWGDYSAAVAGVDGSIYMATEYIEADVSWPPFLANWGTRIINYLPGS